MTGAALRAPIVRFSRALPALAVALLVLPAAAAPQAYTDRAAFEAAVQPNRSLDFDALSPGPVGSGFLGIFGFPTTVADPTDPGGQIDVAVIASPAPFPAGNHTLGTDDPDNGGQFVAGSQILVVHSGHMSTDPLRQSGGSSGPPKDPGRFTLWSGTGVSAFPLTGNFWSNRHHVEQSVAAARPTDTAPENGGALPS